MSTSSTLYLPGFTKTFSTWPVWRDSARKEVKFYPLRKQDAVRIFHHARLFERRTRAPGKQDGKVGRNGILVLHALIFDFFCWRSGRLDPGYEAIARAANISIRSVARGLQALKACGILSWIRRCREEIVDGRFCLMQETNAYALAPSSQWRGFAAPAEPPPPEPGSCGEHPNMGTVLAQAADIRRAGGSQREMVRAMESDPNDTLSLTLARIWRLNHPEAAE